MKNTENKFNYYLKLENKDYYQFIEEFRDESEGMRRIYLEYKRADVFENECLDIAMIPPDNMIEPIMNELKDNDIEEFTISNQASGMQKRISLIQDYGYKMTGLVEVLVVSVDGLEYGPAFKFELVK